MSLKTKSIQLKKKDTDGIRVCIMRKPGDYQDFDIWMPTLAPSLNLLSDYHKNKIDWVGYRKIFNKEVILGQKKFLKIISNLSMKYDITLLCWEKIPEKCHRKLVAEACQDLNPNIKVKIR